MNKLPIIEWSELNKGIDARDNFQDVFSIIDIDGRHDIQEKGYVPMRLEALLVVLTLEGTLEIELDYVSYTVKPDNLIMIMPTHVMQLIRVSEDFKGRLLVAAKEFLMDCDLMGVDHIRSITHYMEIRKNPCMELIPAETERLDICIKRLRERIREKAHFFYKELVQNVFVGFLLEVGDILMCKKEHLVRISLSRKEELFEQFLKLLFEHCKEQHVVTFYAEKLFITPQYLSLILKELTGKSANKWIDEALIVEAKILLKAPQTTVQQVADQLHFSDQSTFGKFFKKHMGISPMEYRRS